MLNLKIKDLQLLLLSDNIDLPESVPNADKLFKKLDDLIGSKNFKDEELPPKVAEAVSFIYWKEDNFKSKQKNYKELVKQIYFKL